MSEVINNTFGNFVKEYRKKNFIRLKDLAFKVGISQLELHNIEESKSIQIEKNLAHKLILEIFK